ncbi:MAG TPA: BON domain-containing protein [Methylophilaceae bacterium]|nr:BON domain-containing protein [Methylophilaceae bacterium]
MKMRPLILGLTLSAAVLVVGCNKNNNEAANPDEMNGTGTSTEMNGTGTGTDMNTPPAAPAGDSQTMGDKVDDGVITTKVKSALLADDTVKGLDINVDTAQGVVSLSGTVDSQTQIDMATQIAKGVEGVKDVQNQLTVKQQ